MTKAVRQLPQFHNIDIRLYIQPDLPEISVDGDQMYQVFLNLALNAADAMPDGGDLMIRVLAEGDRLKIYFEDTGIGIDKNILLSLKPGSYTLALRIEDKNSTRLGIFTKDFHIKEK